MLLENNQKNYCKYLFIVAHPDDAEICAGGTISKLIKKGHSVKVIVLTEGSMGGNGSSRRKTKKIRLHELSNAANYLNYDYRCLKIKDGEVFPYIKYRKRIIAEIKTYKPDVIFTHRFNDYHPDHRYTCKLVEDSLVLICSDKYGLANNYLHYNPIVLYMWDRFSIPVCFRPHLIVNIDSESTKKIKAMYKHMSQFNDLEQCKYIADQNNAMQLDLLSKLNCDISYKYVELFQICEYSLVEEIEMFINTVKNKFGNDFTYFNVR